MLNRKNSSAAAANMVRSDIILFPENPRNGIIKNAISAVIEQENKPIPK
jgi:hypothetical protein